jgi:putative flippase GtrA
MQRLNALLTPQFIVFIAGGLLCAVIDIGVMQWLIAQQTSPVISASSGFLAGLLVNYAFHAKVTFKNVATPATFVRFICVVGINYLITIALVALGVALWQSALVGKLVSLPLVAVNGFFLSKYWIFK